MIDIWRERNPSKKQSRLDHWLISEDLEGRVIKCDVILYLAPDHLAIFQILYDKTEKNIEKKKGSYCKSNNSLCANVEYVKQMKEEIIRLKDELKLKIKDRRVLWDCMKMKIRNFSWASSKRLARDRREKREFLEKEIEKLEHNIIQGVTEGKVKELKKKELADRYKYIHEGILMRSPASY